MTIGLLIFTKNDYVRNLLDIMHDYVDQIIVIDFESSPDVIEQNMRECMKHGALLKSLVDLGYIEIFRTYAFNLFNTDYIINLDPDESPSISLLKRLRKLSKGDLFLVPRFPLNKGNFEYVPRIFSSRNVKWRGYVHELPTTNGHKVFLVPEECIYHLPIDSSKKSIKCKFYRVYEVESLTRPPIMHAFLNTYNLAIPNFLKNILNGIFKERQLSPFFIKSILFFYHIMTKIINSSKAEFSKFYLDYNVEKTTYFSTLDYTNRGKNIQIYLELYKNGGPTVYLNLDDPSYVELLSNKEHSYSGGKFLEYLLNYKYRFGDVWKGDSSVGKD